MVYKVGPAANTVIDGGQSGQSNTSNGFFNNVYFTTLLGNYTRGGENYGYVTGGFNISNYNVIERFPFAVATTNSTDVGDLTITRSYMTGQSSDDYGYSSGGFVSPNTYYNVIERFPFSASSTNATDVGDLTTGILNAAGQSSYTHGYSSGGAEPVAPPNRGRIQKFSFASITTNASGVSSLSVARYHTTGQSSNLHGYTSGGSTAPSTPTLSSVIDRFSFANDTSNALDVGDITLERQLLSGHFSDSYGYVSGGINVSNYNIIERFPFAAATTNASDVGDLTVVRREACGLSSTNYGYMAGGYTAGPAITNIIDRFPFAAATTDAADVGDMLTNGRGTLNNVGQQY